MPSEHIPYGRILSLWFDDPNPPHVDLFTRILYNQHLAEIHMSELSDALTALGATVSEISTYVASLTSNTVTQAQLDAVNAELATATAAETQAKSDLAAAQAEISADAATITSLNSQLAALVPAPPAPAAPAAPADPAAPPAA